MEKDSATHTPGPWNIEYHIEGPTKRHIEISINNKERGYKHLAQIYNGAGITEHEANAKLIAAAPDLLEALKDALFHLQGYLVRYGHGPTMSKKMSAYKSVIEKATK